MLRQLEITIHKIFNALCSKLLLQCCPCLEAFSKKGHISSAAEISNRLKNPTTGLHRLVVGDQLQNGNSLTCLQDGQRVRGLFNDAAILLGLEKVSERGRSALDAHVPKGSGGI